MSSFESSLYFISFSRFHFIPQLLSPLISTLCFFDTHPSIFLFWSFIYLIILISSNVLNPDCFYFGCIIPSYLLSLVCSIIRKLQPYFSSFLSRFYFMDWTNSYYIQPKKDKNFIIYQLIIIWFKIPLLLCFLVAVDWSLILLSSRVILILSYL